MGSLMTTPLADLRPRFHQTIRNEFPVAEAGFVLDTASGRILPQTEPGEPLVTAFVARHAWFFGEEPQAVYLEIPAPDPAAPTRRARPAGVVRSGQPREATIADVLEELANEVVFVGGATVALYGYIIKKRL